MSSPDGPGGPGGAGERGTDHSGGGDPARTLELLWGLESRGTRGPQPALTVDRVVGAAIALADADGLAALSMRRVADELGVGAMTLYRYVPGKAELLDAMLDRVYGEFDRRPVTGGWRANLEQVALANRDLVLRHPWMLSVATSRPPLGPGLMAKYEYELAAVEGIGLDDVEMDAVVALVTGYVLGAVRAALDAERVIRTSGRTDTEWWLAHASLLERIGDATRFPLASRVGTTVGQRFDAPYDAEHGFAFGLARVLDGVAALLATRRP